MPGTWLTDKSFSDRLPRPALKVRAYSSKSSEEDCKGFQPVTLREDKAYNGFAAVSPDFESRASTRVHLTFAVSISA